MKPKIAIYWASSCGGCEIALVNLHERLLELDARFDICFCPCLLDTKKHDLESWPDQSIAVTLFNGAIRTDENLEMAHLLRRKSACLIAYGACAKGGGIPALSNLHSSLWHLSSIYFTSPSVDNTSFVAPQEETEIPEGKLSLPLFHERVKTLAAVVDVDYFIPGCPPESERIWEALTALTAGEPPPQGTVLGAGTTTVCEECSRVKEEKRVPRFRRITEFIPEEGICLLEQGLVCMGIATRAGCGALCPAVNTPCIGCYGPPDGVTDQGARMLAALGSVLDPGDLRGLREEEVVARIEEAARSITDCAGSFYLFTLAESLLKGAARRPK